MRLTRLKDYSNSLKESFGLIAPLRAFLRNRLTLQAALGEIRRALDQREENFLRLAKERIYGASRSPYLALFRHAGCTYADLEARVRGRGLENTLQRLAAEGIYLTSDEFKGKKEVVRGGLSFAVRPGDLALASGPSFTIQSSGTTNAPMPTNVSFDWLAARAPIVAVFFATHDLFSCLHAMYDSILPASGGMNNLLVYDKLGVATERWFARAVPGYSNRHQTFNTYLMAIVAKAWGPGFPMPEFIEIAGVDGVVRWIAESRRRRKRCCVTTAASNAVRIARKALEMGVALEGATFICSGEPLTEAKRDIIARAGGRATVRCTIGGGVNLAFGCGYPVSPDDAHVNESLLALVSHRRTLPGGSVVEPLLMTVLHPAAPRLLLNVESGDYAMHQRRNCGCVLERAGLGLHISGMRSFEKFTSEGMNYNYAELYDLVEKTLPAEFGGGPGDYQLCEEEDENGQTKITLVVHPAVGRVSDEVLLRRLQTALVEGAWHARFWRDAGTLRVRREAPHASARGKILPLHIAGRSARLDTDCSRKLD